MKKSIPQFAVISMIILLTAYQKEGNTETAGVTNEVKTYIEAITSNTLGNTITTYGLKFDIAYRITSMISISDSRDKFLFTYGPNYSYSTDAYTQNGLELHSEIFLNRNLSTDSSFQYNNTGDSSTEKYFYNASNLPVKSNDYNYSKSTGSVLSKTITYSYDAKGNLVSAVGTDGNIDTREFYPDMVYILPNVQPYYRQITNVNLIKKHIVTSNGYPVENTTYSYTFDGHHRVSTETSVSDAGNTIVKTYTYY